MNLMITKTMNAIKATEFSLKVDKNPQRGLPDMNKIKRLILSSRKYGSNTENNILDHYQNFV